MSLTVTATETAHTFNGCLLRIKVLTGAADAASQTGATNHAEAAGPNVVTLTTTTAGSVVYGAMGQGDAVWGAQSGTTIFDDFFDSPNQQAYGSYRITAATGTPGSTTSGAATPTSTSFANIAAAEILASGTIAEDASSPAVATTTSDIMVTSSSFTPPAGSLIVAMVTTNGAADFSGPTTVAVSDTSSLTWTQLVSSASSTTCYAGVWIAQVASGPAGPAGRTLIVPQAVRRAAFY
jgi:hypothetical protein